MRGLEAHGIEVLPSMPGSTFLAEKYRDVISPEHRELFWRGDTQDHLLSRLKPDAVIFSSNWDHYALTEKPDVPLIIDLHGSRLIENELWNVPVDRDRKSAVLGLADCILCAGKFQRNYFYGWLIQAGRIPDDEHFIRYIPISLSPELPARIADSGEYPQIVSGGGWFPWQNQSKAIYAVANAMTRYGRGSFSIYGTPHETDNVSSAEQKIRKIYAEVRSAAERSDRIHVNDYIPRNQLVDIYSQAHVALELMEYNLERELAFTTRTVEYLWSGLPVIYNNYSELSRHINEYDAGWTISPDDEVSIALALDEIFNNRDLLEQKSRNARRLVTDRFSWDKTIRPLVEFLAHPSQTARTYPIKHSTYFMPSFLSPRGVFASGRLALAEQKRQRFILPAVAIKSLQVPVHVDHLSPTAFVEISVSDRRRVIVSRKISAAEIMADSSLQIDFPWFRLPQGGEVLELSLTLQDEGQGISDLRLMSVKDSKYPFLTPEGEETISINFVPIPRLTERIKEQLAHYWGGVLPSS
jgi:glycosyltransferase involved in cell wall biosynthesis